jgi:glycerate 2-kinase
VLALGGSASTDGGAGMLSALGFTFLDGEGQAMSPLAHSLHRIREIRGDNAVELRGIEMIVARDVTNPLSGSTGAAAVFGPQKGATISEIDRLEAGIEVLVSAMRRSRWPEAPALATTPGAGAAGGCGFAALALGARMVSGADYFLDLLKFDEYLCDADLVITGEGRLDQQTLTGKLPAVVAHRAAPSPVIAVVGRNALDRPSSLFAETYAVADRTESDTSNDAGRTAIELQHFGTQIGQRHARHTA